MNIRSLAIGLFALLPGAAHAHNKLVHQDMVDLAFQAMVAARQYSDLGICPTSRLGVACPLAFPPRGVSAEEWAVFVRDMSGAVARLGARPNDLPLPRPGCSSADEPDFATKPTSAMRWVPSVEYRIGSGCGVREGWRPGGVFNGTGIVDPTGAVLGFHAAAVDDEYGDWHLWLRPTSAGGLGKVKKEISDVWRAGVGALVLPFACAFDCIFNSCDDCGGDARDFARGTDPVKNLDGWIPGVGDIHGDAYVGQGHHINLEAGCSNEFDDHQGLLTEEAGPGGVLDIIEVGAMAVQDATGMSVNHAASLGPKRYEITGGGDGHPDSRSRSISDWQFSTSPHTAFTPVDNLAMHGWRAFRDDPAHPISQLGWPLHALGDASVPHHVAGTFGWGHRPFEDAQERNWTRVRHQSGESSFDPANPVEADRQMAQLALIFRAAYSWRQAILDWRSANGGRVDVPIRDLVTSLAMNTRSRASRDPFPINSSASLQYMTDESAAVRTYTDPADAADRMEPYIVDAVGATVAFLVSASEVLQ